MRLAAFLVFITTAWAQAPSAAIILRAARMFDNASGRVVTPGVVVVLGDKIRGIGAAAEIPAGARVIDLGDATLLPGFIDAHTHLSMPHFNDYRDEILYDFRKEAVEKALDATENLRRTLEAGLTTVRDVGAGDFIDVALRNAVRNGKIVGPRISARRTASKTASFRDPNRCAKPCASTSSTAPT